MHPKLRSAASIFLRYIFPLILGGCLLAYFYKDVDVSSLKKNSSAIRWKWIFAAITAHLGNHLLRAYRWGMLLRAQGYKVPLVHTFLAEMGGFCFNMVVPRGGELLRCKQLNKTAKVPLTSSIASVMVERTVDMCSFGLILLITMLWGATMLQSMAASLWGDNMGQSASKYAFTVGGGLVVLLLIAFGFYSLRHSKYFKDYLAAPLQDLWVSIRKAFRASSPQFWLVTVATWFLYFMVEYYSLFILAATSHLNLFAALCLFVVLNISLVLPVPGAIGGYHFAMRQGLLFFSIVRSWADLYITITHSIQMFNSLVIGGLCLAVGWLFVRPIATKISAKPAPQVATE